MTEQEQALTIIDQISKKFGRMIDLQTAPLVMIEILRTYGHAFDGGGGGGGVGGGGGGGGVSSIAVAGPEASVELADVMKVVLNLRRDIKDVSRQIDHLVHMAKQ
jgi:hypothetical protein